MCELDTQFSAPPQIGNDVCAITLRETKMTSAGKQRSSPDSKAKHRGNREREKKKKENTARKEHGECAILRVCLIGRQEGPRQKEHSVQSKTVSAAHFTVNYNGFNLVQQKRASGLSLRPAAITGISVRKLGHISLYLNLHACLSSNDSLQGLMDS